ncbi:MAG: DUF1641 domain-containing protein [Chloroflexaceae bacterium]
MMHMHTNGVTLVEPAPADAPQLAGMMHALLERMERIEQKLARVEALAGQAPMALAVATDTFDSLYREGAQAGVDADERLKLGLIALERLTTPENLRAIAGLAGQLAILDQFTRQAPGLMAMTVDMIDELYAAIGRQGINLEETAREGLVAFRNFVALLHSDEVRALLDSGVIDPRTLQVIGAAADALVRTQREPSRAGPLTLLRALFDRDIQRSLGFALGFAARFGQNLPLAPAEQAHD